MLWAIKEINKETYLNLESYRKSGEGVQTPVWFVEEGGVIYIRTQAESYKVRRICKNNNVRIATCEADGKVKSDWMNAKAVLADDIQAQHADDLLNYKYGFRKRIFDFFNRLQRKKWAVILVHPVDAPDA